MFIWTEKHDDILNRKYIPFDHTRGGSEGL